MSPEKMVNTLFAPAGANSARLFRQTEKWPDAFASGHFIALYYFFAALPNRRLTAPESV